MGKRGPKPTPKKILKMRGSWRGDLNENAPEPEIEAPDMPEFLDEYGQAAWKYLIPELKKMQLLAKIDRDALTIYCETWAQWRKSVDFLRKNGETFTQTSGHGGIIIKKLPQVSIMESAADRLVRIQQQFGLNPSARSRIEVPDKTSNPLAEKMKKFGIG